MHPIDLDARSSSTGNTSAAWLATRNFFGASVPVESAARIVNITLRERRSTNHPRRGASQPVHAECAALQFVRFEFAISTDDRSVTRA
jgi:hypothetical protein